MAFHFQNKQLDEVMTELAARGLTELFELDEIAYFILAAVISHKYKTLPHRGGVGSQSDESLLNEPGERCVAVFRRSDALYIAANNIWKTSEMRRLYASFVKELDIAELEKQDLRKSLQSDPAPLFANDEEVADFKFELASELVRQYGFRQIIFLDTDRRYHNTKFHAEMQLLSLMCTKDIVPDSAYVGVSKPCCHFCVEKLELAGLQFANRHKVHGDDPSDRLVGLPHLDKSQLRALSRLVELEKLLRGKMPTKRRSRKM
jgi:hypothetical protein